MGDADARDAVTERLARLFDEWGAHRAIEFAGHWWTWADVGAVRAALLTAGLGDLPDGAPVGVIVRQRPACLAALLAILAEGRGVVVVSPLQGDQALAADVARLGVGLLVADADDWQRPGVLQAVAAAGAVGVAVSGGLPAVVQRIVEPVGSVPTTASLASEAAITVLTSGTTGPAKRLPVSWSTFVQLGGGPGSREPRTGGAIILSLPLVTLGGLLSITRLVFGGRPLAMLERFEVWAWAALVREHRPVTIGAPPPAIPMILEAGIPPEWFEGVTAFVTASAPVDPAVAAEFEARYGIPVLQGYGATEFLGAVTGWTSELSQRFGAAKVGSVGRVLPGVRLRVVDAETGAEVEPGVEGIVEVDPPQRAEGLVAGWLRTSDRGLLDRDGFLWILGRVDEVIIRGGFKVDLGLVESALREHPAVTDACAVGMPDARLGQVPGAVVVLDPGAVASADDLLAWLRDRLPPYAVPAVVKVVAAVPSTSTMKRHRAEVLRLLDT